MAQAKPLISGNIIYKTVGVGNYQIFLPGSRRAAQAHCAVLTWLPFLIPHVAAFIDNDEAAPEAPDLIKNFLKKLPLQ